MTAHPCLHCLDDCDCGTPEECDHDCDDDEPTTHGENCVCVGCESGDPNDEETIELYDSMWREGE